MPPPNPALATPLGGLIVKVFYILNLVLPIIGALALIWFFWGIIQYVLKADNEEKQAAARSYMIYAVIGMFVMFSVWGLVALVRNTFFRHGDPFTRLLPTDIPIVPRLPTTP
ncbi:MAG: pilin [bacterium]|nr:pilin [bacterium]